jgi:hypothetical protein
MSDKEKYSGAVWFVRGVPAELRAEVAAAAEEAGMKVGPWVERALRAALGRPVGQGAPPDQGAAGDLAALVAEISATVDATAEAVRVLFERHRREDFSVLIERVERLEASQAVPAIPSRSSDDGDKGRVPAAIPSGQRRALDAVEPVGSVEVPEMAETHPGASQPAGRRSPRKWTDADDAELRRIFDRGASRANACREMGRGSSVISPKWAALLQERAEQTLPPIEQVRRVSEMQKAGTPDVEIAAFLKGEREEPEPGDQEPEPDQGS